MGSTPIARSMSDMNINSELMAAYEKAIRDLQVKMNFRYDYPVIPFNYDQLQWALEFLLIAYDRSKKEGTTPRNG